MPLPPLYALRAFETAARLGSFSHAAKYLHVTPGAVSRHVRTLEHYFSCELFTRKGPRVEITQAGRRLAAQLEEGFHHLEQACHAFRSHQQEIRLKSPSTLTMSWLLNVSRLFREQHPLPRIQIASVWMDTDRVDFTAEPYDCAILLGNGQYGDQVESHLLFDEWLIPVCAPGLVVQAQQDLPACELIHPSPDARDWRRWLKKTGVFPGMNLARGTVFDTLEQGNMAAVSGHGVSVGDLLLSLSTIERGILAIPFPQAVATGDSYYFVCPKGALTGKNGLGIFYQYLKSCVPAGIPEGVLCLEKGAAASTGPEHR